MKYGPNTKLVEEVIDFVGNGELFSGTSEAFDASVILEHDLERAVRIVYGEEDDEEDEDLLTWPEIKEEEMSSVVERKGALPEFEQASEEILDLADSLGDLVAQRFTDEYDDFVDEAAADFYNAACNRAVNGLGEGLLEKIFDVYRKGGVPCGWSGKYPEGKMIVYVRR